MQPDDEDETDRDGADGLEATDRRAGRDRATMPAKEFVSERDALADLWAQSPEPRDEGW